MKSIILKKMFSLLAPLKCEVLSDIGNNQTPLNKVDKGVLKVAMMVAALDGNVMADEFKVFEKLTHYFHGYTKASAAEALDEGLHLAGYLELQAKRLNERDLVALFLDEVESVMPNQFVREPAEEIRRAFIVWTAMAMADGDYSSVERKCITAMRNLFDEKLKAYAQSREMLRSASPEFTVAYHEGHEPAQAPDEAFLRQAEKLLAQLTDANLTREAYCALKVLMTEGVSTRS